MKTQTLNEDFAVLDPAVAIQEAHDKAIVSKWTIARHSAALSMGATILSGVFGPEMKGLEKKGTYPNALRDVVIVGWLCSLDPEAVDYLNAHLNLDEAIAAAFAWAEKEGICYGSPRYIKGVNNLTEIVGGIYASFYAIDTRPKSPQPSSKKNIKSLGKSRLPTTR